MKSNFEQTQVIIARLSSWLILDQYSRILCSLGIIRKRWTNPAVDTINILHVLLRCYAAEPSNAPKKGLFKIQSWFEPAIFRLIVEN